MTKTMKIIPKCDIFIANFSWTVLHRYLELGAEIETGNKWDLEFLVPEKKNQSKKDWSKKKMADKIFGRK